MRAAFVSRSRRCSRPAVGPWADQHPGVISELHAIGAADNRRVRVAERRGDYTALEGLYALSRVLDVLIAPFQPVNDDPALLSWVTGKPWWTRRLPGPAAFPMRAAAIGATRISEQRATIPNGPPTSAGTTGTTANCITTLTVTSTSHTRQTTI